MHEFIDSPDDVLALRMSGTVTGEDLDPVMDRLEAIMAKHDKVHVYVETRDIDGLQLSTLPDYLSRAFPLFGKLGRFGRVAVVADQAWIRVATRFESALLPNISYRVFELEERDEALAWALGNGPAATAAR